MKVCSNNTPSYKTPTPWQPIRTFNTSKCSPDYQTCESGIITMGQCQGKAFSKYIDGALSLRGLGKNNLVTPTSMMLQSSADMEKIIRVTLTGPWCFDALRTWKKSFGRPNHPSRDLQFHDAQSPGRWCFTPLDLEKIIHSLVHGASHLWT